MDFITELPSSGGLHSHICGNWHVI